MYRVTGTGVLRQYDDMFVIAKASLCGAWESDSEDGFFAYLDCIMMPGLKIRLLRFSMSLEKSGGMNA